LYLTLLLSAAMAVGGVPSPIQLPVGISSAFADDDDDDGGGGSRASGGGGDRTMRGPAPRAGNIMRLFKRQSRQGRPRNAQPRRARASQRAAPALIRAPSELVASGLSAPQIDSLVASGYAVVAREDLMLAGAEILKLRVPDGRTLETARDEIAAVAPAARVDFNHYYRPDQERSCGGQPCVAPTLVGWPTGAAARQSCDLSRVTIGLVDTAINAGHPTFAGGRLEVIQLDGGDAAGSGRQHGTAVASLLIGKGEHGTPGLVRDAQLVAVDAFRRSGASEALSDAYDLVRAIDLLAARKVDVLNLSLSGPDNVVLRELIAQVTARNITLVAAAGNEGPNARAVYPAAYPEVVAVTAVDRQKNAYRRANRGDYVDLAAPGVGVWVAASVEGTRPKTGTSFAAPFVTAAVALAKSGGATSNDEIQRMLARTAEDLGNPGKDPVYGWGLLNARDLCGSR